MRLNVENLAEEDFGNYTCIAKNPRGNVTGVITLTGVYYVVIGDKGQDPTATTLLRSGIEVLQGEHAGFNRK